MEVNEDAYLKIVINDGFLEAQMALYKIEYGKTGDNKYLEVMNQMNETIKCFRHLRKTVERLAIENRELKNNKNET